MTTIAISYSERGFEPTNTTARPGDTITVTNTSGADVSLSFTCESVPDPLAGLTSPVDVPGNDGSVSGDVREEAANQTILFSANGAECTVEVGPARYQLTFSPSSIAPPSLDVEPDDEIVFYNESNEYPVTLEIESTVPDPFGAEVGQQPTIAALGDLVGVVQRAAAKVKVKVTVKGSTSVTSSINVGSGDVELH